MIIAIHRFDGAGGALTPLLVQLSNDSPGRVITDFGGGTGFGIQRISASEQVVGVEQLGGTIWRIDLSSGEAVLVGGAANGEGQAMLSDVVAGSVFYTTGPATEDMSVRVAEDGGSQEFLAPEGPAEAAAFRTNGSWMTWQELSEPSGFLSWNRVRLMFARHGTPPVPEYSPVELPGTSPLPFACVGEGLVAIPDERGHVVVLDRLGSTVRTLPVPEGDFPQLDRAILEEAEIGVPLTNASVVPNAHSFAWIRM